MDNNIMLASALYFILGRTTPDFALANQYNKLVTPTSICETYTPQTHTPLFGLPFDLGLDIPKKGIEGKLKN